MQSGELLKPGDSTNPHLTTHMPTLVVWKWHPWLCFLCTAYAEWGFHGFPALLHFKEFFRRQLNLQAAWQGHGCVPPAPAQVTSVEPSMPSSVLPFSDMLFCTKKSHHTAHSSLLPLSMWLYYCSFKLNSCDLYSKCASIPEETGFCDCTLLAHSGHSQVVHNIPSTFWRSRTQEQMDKNYF